MSCFNHQKNQRLIYNKFPNNHEKLSPKKHKKSLLSTHTVNPIQKFAIQEISFFLKKKFEWLFIIVSFSCLTVVPGHDKRLTEWNGIEWVFMCNMMWWYKFIANIITRRLKKDLWIERDDFGYVSDFDFFATVSFPLVPIFSFFF